MFLAWSHIRDGRESGTSSHILGGSVPGVLGLWSSSTVLSEARHRPHGLRTFLDRVPILLALVALAKGNLSPRIRRPQRGLSQSSFN